MTVISTWYKQINSILPCSCFFPSPSETNSTPSMAGTCGLSLCHTSRGRLTTVTVLISSLAVLGLLYNSDLLGGRGSDGTTRRGGGGGGGGAQIVPDYAAELPRHRLGERRSRVWEDRRVYTDYNSGSPAALEKNCNCNSSSSGGGSHGRNSRRFPSALIIGARKGGTRALINMLNCHPDVVAAAVEVHYFDRDENFERGVQWYIDQMPLSSRSQVTIEKSPSYFVSPQAPARIRNMSPRMKVILIVRNPLDRAVSDFTQLLRKTSGQRLLKSFEEQLFLPSGKINSKFSPLTVSLYDVHFQNWLDYFDLEQIHIVDGDALIKNPVSELEKVGDFLEVDSFFREDMFYFNATKGFYCWRKRDDRGHASPVCLGSAKGHAPPPLSNRTVQRLSEFFEPHNERFFAQIRRRFNWDSKYSIVVNGKF